MGDQNRTVLDMHKPKWSPLAARIERASKVSIDNSSLDTIRRQITDSFYGKSTIDIELNPTEYMSKQGRIFGKIVDVGTGFGTGRHLAERNRAKKVNAGLPVGVRKTKFNFTKNTKHTEMQTEDPGLRDPGNPVPFVLPIERPMELKLLALPKGSDIPKKPFGEKI